MNLESNLKSRALGILKSGIVVVYLVKNKILGKADCCLKRMIAIASSSLCNSDTAKGVRQGKQVTWTASLLCHLLPDPFCDLI